VLHQPRVDAYAQSKVPALTPEETDVFVLPRLRNQRAALLASVRAAWQQRYWKRLDRAEAIARERGIGREGIRRTFGRLVAPEISDVYDAGDLLALPWHGREDDPARIRQAIGALVIAEPDPTPPNYIFETAIGPQLQALRRNILEGRRQAADRARASPLARPPGQRP
jgi:hypothetical protein